jgi:hypothetical protein
MTTVTVMGASGVEKLVMSRCTPSSKMAKLPCLRPGTICFDFLLMTTASTLTMLVATFTVSSVPGTMSCGSGSSGWRLVGGSCWPGRGFFFCGSCGGRRRDCAPAPGTRTGTSERARAKAATRRVRLCFIVM